MITGLKVGGAENLVVQYADRFSEINHTVTIIYLTGPIELKPINKNIELQSLDINKNPLSVLKAFYTFHKIIKQKNPDIVHSHLFHANIFARIYRLLFPIKKLICSVHNSVEKNSFRKILYRATDSVPNITTNVSKEAVDIFIKNKLSQPTRIIPVYNGINTNKFSFNSNERESLRKRLNINEDTICLLAVGRLTLQKNYPSLLRVLSKIIVENNNIQLLIAGDGPDKQALKNLIYSLKLTNHVSLLGNRDDIAALMSTSDIFVLSSSWEGFGLVVAEAMACERQVIATNSGGVKEVLGQYGTLIPANDDDALFSALNKSITTPDNSLNEQARRHIIETFSLESIIQQWLDIYNAY